MQAQLGILLELSRLIDLGPGHHDYPPGPGSSLRWHADVLEGMVTGSGPSWARCGKLNLATCSYSAVTDQERVLPIATSVGKPRGWAGAVLNAVAPYGIFNHKPAYDRPTFERLYFDRLDRKRVEIDQALTDLSVANPRTRLVVCCWCDLGTPESSWCHRRLFAHWAWTRYHVDVPELTGSGNGRWR